MMCNSVLIDVLDQPFKKYEHVITSDLRQLQCPAIWKLLCDNKILLSVGDNPKVNMTRRWILQVLQCERLACSLCARRQYSK